MLCLVSLTIAISNESFRNRLVSSYQTIVLKLRKSKINRSKDLVRDKINQSYSPGDLPNMTNVDFDEVIKDKNDLQKKSNPLSEIFNMFDSLINGVKDYYFLIAGFVVFFTFSLCGSIIALISSLIAVMLLRVTSSLDGQKKNAS